MLTFELLYCLKVTRPAGQAGSNFCPPTQIFFRLGRKDGHYFEHWYNTRVTGGLYTFLERNDVSRGCINIQPMKGKLISMQRLTLILNLMVNGDKDWIIVTFYTVHEDVSVMMTYWTIQLPAADVLRLGKAYWLIFTEIWYLHSAEIRYLAPADIRYLRWARHVNPLVLRPIFYI